MKTWKNDGNIPMDYKKSYIYGPQKDLTSTLQVRDPVGKLYEYP
jgi:hypothetical protein